MMVESGISLDRSLEMQSSPQYSEAQGSHIGIVRVAEK